jgi:hypothetical protein
MAHGANRIFYGSIASGASTVSFDLGQSWRTVYAEIGTMSTIAQVNIYAGASGAASYRQVYHTPVNSATVVVNPYVISNVVGTGGGTVPVPGGIQHMQFRTTAVVSGGVSFTIFCSDS